LERSTPRGGTAARRAATRLGSVADILANSSADRHDPDKPRFLAPCDLQALKACGVTFVSSLSSASSRKRPGRAGPGRPCPRTLIDANRNRPVRLFGRVQPGAKVKDLLVQRGLWSPYLEVGIGPDAEVFTKSQPMAAVGTGREVRPPPRVHWKQSRSEIVLAFNSRGETVGASSATTSICVISRPQRPAARQGQGHNGSCASVRSPAVRRALHHR